MKSLVQRMLQMEQVPPWMSNLWPDGMPVPAVFEDAARRASLSTDNLTLVVFMHEALPLLRKIRADRIVLEVLGKSSFYWDLELRHSMQS
jgi:hypothetical protein